jgi:hypothetical protein
MGFLTKCIVFSPVRTATGAGALKNVEAEMALETIIEPRPPAPPETQGGVDLLRKAPVHPAGK